MKTTLYKINTLSNLHVGSGDINFNVIDNQVQRDPVTNLPNINSSSLKGAFREVVDLLIQAKFGAKKLY
jgi:CRISPR-associated protein Cmr4